MADRIISLNCPSCGSAGHDGLRERSFGGEMKCGHCGITSVLVIDNQWHQKKSSEQVCRVCGRVAPRGARFCQCSESLVRKCTNCQHEFFVDDLVCPQCGWNYSEELGDETTQRSIASDLTESLRVTDFDLAAKKLRSLLASITTSQQMTSEAEVVLRDILVLLWANSNLPSREFNVLANAIPAKVGHHGGIDKWVKHHHEGIDKWRKHLKTIDSQIEEVRQETFRAQNEDDIVQEKVMVWLFAIVFGLVGAVIGFLVELMANTILSALKLGFFIGLGSFVASCLIGFVVTATKRVVKLSGLRGKKAQLEREREAVKRRR